MSSKKTKKQSKKQSKKASGKSTLKIDFSKVMKHIKITVDKFKNMSFEQLKKIENDLKGIEMTDDDNKAITMIQELLAEQRYKLSTKDLDNFGSELKSNSKSNSKFPCLFKYKDVKLKEGREEWENEIYETSKNGKQLIIKTRNLKPMTIYQQKRLEKELRLSKKASEKGLGPKIEEIFYCKTKTSEYKLFLVYERIKAGSLEDWSKTNTLTQQNKTDIKKLINTLYENDIIPSYISDRDILVDNSNPKKMKFLFNKYKNSSSIEDIIEEKKENSSEDLEWLSNFNESKINNLVCNYLVKKKIIRLTF